MILDYGSGSGHAIKIRMHVIFFNFYSNWRNRRILSRNHRAAPISKYFSRNSVFNRTQVKPFMYKSENNLILKRLKMAYVFTSGPYLKIMYKAYFKNFSYWTAYLVIKLFITNLSRFGAGSVVEYGYTKGARKKKLHFLLDIPLGGGVWPPAAKKCKFFLYFFKEAWRYKIKNCIIICFFL